VKPNERMDERCVQRADARTRRLGLRRAAFGAAGMLVALGLALASSASAASLTWTGAYPGTSESAAHWSRGENWEGGVPPSAAQSLETLTFPHLTSSACTSTPETDSCYGAANDVPGLSTESLRLDDGDHYFLGGEGIALGAGGLTAEPSAGASGPGVFLEMPLQLSAPQRWSIAGNGSLAEEGLYLGGSITGADGLGIELSGSAGLYMENEIETGPVTLEGRDASGSVLANGLAVLAGGQVNSANHDPVGVDHAALVAFGALGALTLESSIVDVGSAAFPAEGLEASSASLDSASGIAFLVSGGGSTAREDYPQLTSSGPVSLAGLLEVLIVKPSNRACPTLTPGERYTFVKTASSLSGTFANAPEGGPEIPIAFTKACSHSPQTMRIGYNRTGGTATVTGTVEAAVKEREEAQANQQRERELAEREAREREVREQETKHEEALRKLVEEHAKKVGEEAATLAIKKHQEEEAGALATKKHQEEEALTKRQQEAARDGVLGSIVGSKPKPLTRAQLLAKALGQCRREPKHKRARCEATAHRRYGKKTPSKTSKRG
jgi:hypothetical protein